MADNVYILEHEILKALYTKVSFTVVGEGKLSGKTMPAYKRDYQYSSLHFGTLVDIINYPEKYTDDKIPKDQLNYLKNKIVTVEEVDAERMKYNWIEVNDALEVLVLNGHITESPVEIHIYSDSMKREVRLTNKGAIDYRMGFYLKEAGKELSIMRGYEIQKRDLWLKKYWWCVEAAKYIMGGIIGAAIAIAISRIRKSPDTKTGKLEAPIQDTVSPYTKTGISLSKSASASYYLDTFYINN
ncbi:hypothetical protein [Terrimonas pollutisoli]|uniref:hypothetical protein n=1 Tax=Terrimonas pollutisoli TaxID=3034147 RepID=UPI0023EC34EA|nr:hypothetical protein [Terrimonas sp. H1YJ31]